MNNDAIKQYAYSLGAEVCGIAGIESFANAPKGFHPADIFPGAQSVIVYGRQFPKSVFETSTNVPYTLVRNKLMQFIDDLSIQFSFKLEEQGYRAVPVPSSDPYEFWDSENRHGRGILSLKHSAELAGLGCIGKNTLLVNEKYGNRLWLGAVITNAELGQDPITEKLCLDNCSICIDSCPQSALDGITIDQKKCRALSGSRTDGGGLVYSCNLCRKLCHFCR